MSNELDARIAAWAWISYPQDWCIPEYTARNSAAIELLPLLVARGYAVDLFNDGDTWLFIACREPIDTGGYVEGNTIAEAITRAVLTIIKQEERQ